MVSTFKSLQGLLHSSLALPLPWTGEGSSCAYRTWECRIEGKEWKCRSDGREDKTRHEKVGEVKEGYTDQSVK